jgi:hypothetical protein
MPKKLFPIPGKRFSNDSVRGRNRFWLLLGEGEGVAEHMGGDGLVEIGHFAVFLDHEAHRLFGQAETQPICSTGAVSLKSFSCLFSKDPLLF